MAKGRNIQIGIELFVDLLDYIIRHAEEGEEQYERIRQGVLKKIDSLLKHELYTLYKTGATADVRAKARDEYLEAIGLQKSYRWSVEKDFNVNHSNS